MQWHKDLAVLLLSELRHSEIKTAWQNTVAACRQVMAHARRQEFPLSPEQSMALWEQSVEDRATLSTCIEQLRTLIPQYAPKVASIYGPYLAEFLWGGMFHAMELEAPASWPWGHRMHRQAPDNLLIDPEQAALAYQLSQDQIHWLSIAKQLKAPYNLSDPQQKARARQWVRERMHRGKVNSQHGPSPQQ